MGARKEEEEGSWYIVRRGTKLCQDLAMIAGQPNTFNLVYIMGHICQIVYKNRGKCMIFKGGFPNVSGHVTFSAKSW